MYYLFKTSIYALKAMFICFMFTFILCCEKEQISEIATDLAVKNDEVQTRLAATRKLRTLIIIDGDTGSQQTHYDCTSKGRSCDVGEPVQPPRTLKTDFINSYSITDIENGEFLKDSNSNSHFPLFSSSEIFDKVQNGELRFNYKDNYLVLLDTESGIGISGYDLTNGGISSPRYSLSSDETKLGKINTQTGIMECKEPGTNCTTAKSATDREAKTLISIVDEAFPNKNLVFEAQQGNYVVSKTNNMLVFTPNDNSQSYFIRLEN